jgi:hypothetical protein
MLERAARNPRRRAGTPALLAIALAGVCTATPAAASEGGASLYLLGSGGPGAAVVPPVEGVFFNNMFYFYDGSAEAEKQFVVGGKVVAGLDATIAADFATVLWVPSTNVLGGTFAIGAALPVGVPDVTASAVLTGPGGGTVGVSRQDSAFVIGDPIIVAELGWDVGGDSHLALSTQTNVPVGMYREDQLANLAFHRWAVDASLAGSWHDPKLGWDISLKAGVTFNGTNHVTDYTTGTEAHFEASIERLFSPKVSAGLQGYRFVQLSGDSGAGAVLGPNKGRVTGVGVTAAYNFPLGKMPATLRGSVFEEFQAERRLEGTSVMLSLTVPLSMKLPPGAG